MERYSFFWQIKRPFPSPPAYLFGTIHVPYTKVWDSIPQSVKDAFHDSHHIVFELNLLKPRTRTNLLTCQLLPEGIKLVDVLPRTLFLQLKRHLDYVRTKIPLWLASQNRDIVADNVFIGKTKDWQKKRPMWIVVMLNQLTEYAIKTDGIPVLDMYLFNLATNSNKTIGSVERVSN